MARPDFRRDTVGPQKKQESLQRSVIVGQTFGIKPLECVLVSPFVVEARLPHRCDDDPVAPQIDGVSVALIDG